MFLIIDRVEFHINQYNETGIFHRVDNLTIMELLSC